VSFTNQVLHYGFFWQIMSCCVEENPTPAKSWLVSNLRVVYQPLLMQNKTLHLHMQHYNLLIHMLW